MTTLLLLGDEMSGRTLTVTFSLRCWTFGVSVDSTPPERLVYICIGPIWFTYWRDRCVVEPTPGPKHPLLHAFVPSDNWPGLCAHWLGEGWCGEGAEDHIHEGASVNNQRVPGGHEYVPMPDVRAPVVFGQTWHDQWDHPSKEIR